MVTVATTPRLLVDNVKDPELPALTIGDLGIVRSVETLGRKVTVTITPTYSGCPAMETIRGDIAATLADHGYQSDIRTSYLPAWTTDMITEDGRRRLEAIGVAPPAQPSDAVCPRCRATQPRMASEFGSTACKALMICASCKEPFDLFKELK